MENKKVKSIFVTIKEEMVTGKLNTRDENAKLFCKVLPKKTLSIGDKVSLRCAIRKFNGNFLIYVHSFGWTEVPQSKFEEVFQSKSKDFERLLTLDYCELSNQEKIQMFNQYHPEVFGNLTKTERLLMGYYNGEDLNELERSIQCDKSLKYKIRKNSDMYATKFLNKIEQAI